MDKLKKYIRFGCLAIVLLSVSCVRDGLDECPDPEPDIYSSYIKFVYDYNMAYEDLFHRQATKIDLFLFDQNDVFLHKLHHEEPADSTIPRGFKMGIPREFENAVHFIAFPGIHTDALTATAMVEGKSTISDLRVHLNANDISQRSLKPLWHGNKTITRSTRATQTVDTTVINLIKNTNSIRIVLHSTSEEKLNIENFLFDLRSENGAYDAYNKTTTAAHRHYRQFLHETSADVNGGAVELHTLRLLRDRENRLTVKNTVTNDTILDVNMNQMLEMLRLEHHSGMELQEFLDREDAFHIVVLLTYHTDGLEEKWVVTGIKVNDWTVRDLEAVI